MNITDHLSSREDLDENHVIDTCFCHGTSGLAHFFNRMHKETGNAKYLISSNYWMKKTIEMGNFADGYAGFKTWHTEKFGGWVHQYYLLEGIIGIGLTTLSFADTNISMEWDSVFLMS